MANRVLIAPLNWGLGHATRCIPIIRALLQQGVEVHIASDGHALALLKKEFPVLIFHELQGYNVKYYTNSGVVNMLLNGPKIFWAIWKEHLECRRLQKRYQFKKIISDNRYGCRIKGVQSVIITHQVHLPEKNPIARFYANMLHHALLRKFDEIAIPDNESFQDRLAGNMSNALHGIRCQYLGTLSRFSSINEDHTLKNIFDCLVVLSGPEPQRTKLEEELILKLELSSYKRILIVRGLPKAPVYQASLDGNYNCLPTANLKQLKEAGANHKFVVVNFLLSGELRNVIQFTPHVITRSGYTTVMDLAAIGKKAIYVPTPGQPEQELLAANLHEKGLGIMQVQGNINIEANNYNESVISTVDITDRSEALLKTWVKNMNF